MQKNPNMTTAEVVYQAVVDLTNSNRAASRQIVSNMTGLKMSIVDDHFKRMKDDGKLRLVINGIVEPVEPVRADRPVSVTFYKGGVKLEVGDVCMELSMRETRDVGLATGGVGMQYGR